MKNIPYFKYVLCIFIQNYEIMKNARNQYETYQEYVDMFFLYLLSIS
jgi:tetrahydromethanopterin S-methyltransferase subunit E